MGSFQVTLTAEECKRLGIKPKKEKIDKAIMPGQISVLKASDICKGDYTKGSKHDLTGWRNINLYGKDRAISSPKDKIVMKFTEAIRKAIESVKPDFSAAKSIADYNDAIDTKPAEIAAVWNKAMQALGYDENGVLKTKTQKGKTKK